jgi:hypothetical protein
LGDWYAGDTFSYAFTVPNGVYAITMKWAEYRSTPQNNPMDVLIEGTTVLSNFNFVSAAGGVQKAYDRTFYSLVSDGVLNISFVGLAGGGTYSAGINGLVITDLGGRDSATTTGKVTVTGAVRLQ